VADACIVASAHRLNLLPRFDRVVLMEEGRVLDSGCVDDLLARQPLFGTCGTGLTLPGRRRGGPGTGYFAFCEPAVESPDFFGSTPRAAEAGAFSPAASRFFLASTTRSRAFFKHSS
jgi:hypothetical protein